MQVAMKSPNLNEFPGMDSKKLQLISPIIKHSRGARFLDLVKSNKLNVSPQLNRRMSLNGRPTKELMEKFEKRIDYLSFSNDPAPNLNSSPSSSILSKRKSQETPESSNKNSAKRKRVSFNDPVSTTKEYLITEEEKRQKSYHSLIRCLTYENDESNKQDEGADKENLINASAMETENLVKIEETQEFVKIKTENINSVDMDHNYDENTQNTDITTSSNDDVTEAIGNLNNNTLVFKDNSDVLDYVTTNFTFSEVFEKFLETDVKRKEMTTEVLAKIDLNDILDDLLPLQDNHIISPEQLDRMSSLLNHLSRVMKMNDRVKHKVLDTLSEKHSKDFLSHAIQENSVATVCQKITIPSIINFLVHKVNVCEDDEEVDFEVNRMNRTIMHHLIKKTSMNREIVDQKEIQEMLKLMFKNMQKIEVLDTVHEFLRSNIIQGQY